MIEQGMYWHVRCDECGEVLGDEENAYVVQTTADAARRWVIASGEATIHVGTGRVTCVECGRDLRGSSDG